MKKCPSILFLSALLLAGGCNSAGTTPAPVPTAGRAVQHVVILLQENRSFNNIFAGFPGATTAMEGPCVPRAWCTGSHTIKLRPVKLESNGDPNFGVDIDHSHRGFGLECNANAANVCQNDGFDLISFGESGEGHPAHKYPYAYVDRTESKPYWDLAKQFSLADEMFFTETASSYIAHQSILTGSVVYNGESSLTDQPNNTPWGCDAPPGGPTSKKYQLTFTPLLFKNGRYKFYGPFPCFDWHLTIADLLDAKKVSWRYYVDSFEPGRNFDFSGAVWNGVDDVKKIACPTHHGNPKVAITCDRGPDWKYVSMPNTNVFKDLQNGTLPSVSWVIPTLFDSDHPASGCNGGPWWITKVVNAIGTSSYWKNTVVVLMWDDWGGWYDPVPPPQITYTRLGFRVGMVVISPYARPGYVSHTQYDFGSLLKYIEETFGLGSLGTTDSSANSIGDMLNVSQRPNPFKAAPLPKVEACGKLNVGPAAMRRLIKYDGGIPE